MSQNNNEEPKLNNDDNKSLDHNVFGKTTVILRNFCGTIACITICIDAVINAYTVYVGVSSGAGYPGMGEMIMMNSGPIIIAWSFMNVNKIMQTLMKFKTVADELREKAVNVLSKDADKKL